MDRTDFINAIGQMQLEFRQEMPEAEIELWGREVKGRDTGMVQSVLASLCAGLDRSERDRSFMPKLPELRRALAMASVRPPAEAWELVKGAIGKPNADGMLFGRDLRPTFHDKKIERAVRLTGWLRVNDEEETWVRKDFERHYIESCELEFKGRLSSEGKFLTVENLKLIGGA